MKEGQPKDNKRGGKAVQPEESLLETAWYMFSAIHLRIPSLWGDGAWRFGEPGWDRELGEGRRGCGLDKIE